MSSQIHNRVMAAILMITLLLTATATAEGITDSAPIELDELQLDETAIVSEDASIVIDPDLAFDLLLVGNEVESSGEGVYIPKALTLGVKETWSLGVNMATFISSSPGVASVSQGGIITANKKGTAKITVKSGRKTVGVCKVTVKKAPSKVALVPKTLTLELGQTAVLTAKLPSGSASQALTWSSSDERVAMVDPSGHVTSIGPGTASIVVRTFNKKKDACTVTVTEPEPTPEPPEGWTLTQYPDASGNNAMCYSLVNQREGILILVDGGWQQNADTVRRIIDENGGRVTAWFLTHFHSDHIGAFNEIYGAYKDRIGTIYVNPLDWDTFESVAKYWDTPEAFSSFLEQTAGADNVVRLHRGDGFKIGDARVYVFSAFDDIVRQITGDWPNNSSLVFKLTFDKDSVLFMGDVWAEEMSQYLLDTHGAEALHADYIQTGHHGNASIPIDFYAALHPKALFLDGPAWLMTGEKYKAKDLLAECAERGIKTYDYRQAPNRFRLK